MKEKIKVFLKKLKNILPLLLACLLVGAMVLGLYVFSQSKQMNTLSASAEEAPTASTSTVSDVESGLDLSQYPSANLIPFRMSDYQSSYTSNGVTFTVNSDGSFTANGTAIGTSIYLIENFSFTLPVGTYTVSGAVGGSSTTYVIQIATSEYAQAWNGTNGTVFTLSKEETMLVQLVVYKGTTVSNLLFKPMINRGSVAYPFVPHFDTIYNQGYGAGEIDGYNEGKEDGLNYARAGYWIYTNVHVDIKGSSNGANVSDSFDISPVITSNGVDLSNVYTEINSKYPNLSLTDCVFSLQFTEPVYVDGMKLRCIGDSSIIIDETLSVSIYDPLTKTFKLYKGRFWNLDGSTTVSGLQLQITSENELVGKQIVSITSSSVQHISQFKDLRFYTTDTMANTSYEAGRVAGYNAGFEDGIDGLTEQAETAYNNGYGDGFDLGKSLGFNEGLVKGQTNDPYDLGDFLFSIIDAPFRVIREGLNFEILGYDVSKLVLFVITAFLVIFVVKKIKGT